VIGIVSAEQVTAGGYHSCGLRDNGRAFCWGFNGYGQVGDGTTENRWTATRVSN
jgi:alpha-tubulin suppressor-like RCC1 family protein